VTDDWCWFVLREKYCWLIAGGWFVLREKYCWLVADKPSEQGDGELPFFHIKSEAVLKIRIRGPRPICEYGNDLVSLGAPNL
jgi:hypothetical protein